MGLLIDTCVWIQWGRRGRGLEDLVTKASQDQIWLSAVVMEELYVGARPGSFERLREFELAFVRDQRVVAPSWEDWTQAGLALAYVGRRYGFDLVRHSRMTNDALIAMTAARTGHRILTFNAKDFEMLSEFRSFEFAPVALAYSA